MSGCSFPENAVSGVFGLMSSASDAAGRDASPMASIENQGTAKHESPENPKTKPGREAGGLRQTLNRDVNIAGTVSQAVRMPHC